MRYVLPMLACAALILPACSRSEEAASTPPAPKATAEKHDHDDGSHEGHSHAEKPAAKEATAEKPAGEKPSAEAKPASAEGARTVEVGCATCTYDMEGVEGCVTAAKIDGKPTLVTGESPDAHEIGLCSAPKQATLVGEIKGDKFVATRFTIK